MEKIAIFVFLFIFLLFAITFNTSPVKDPDIYANPIPQGCFIYAASYQASLNARLILDDEKYWSRMAGIKFKDSDLYHSILVFAYKGNIWIYDCNLGSFKVSSGMLYDLKEILEIAYQDAEIEDSIWIDSIIDHKRNIEE